MQPLDEAPSCSPSPNDISGPNDLLDSDKIQDTIDRLCLRIEDRFPGSGLSRVARRLDALVQETRHTIAWIERPYYTYRVLAGIVIFLSVLGIIYGLSGLEVRARDNFMLSDLVQATEAMLSEIVLVGAALIFVATSETRIKRIRAIASINRLRSLAHVIDAHQLTKDPSVTCAGSTEHSPKRVMSEYELSRYLDYCTELLSLTGKVGFLYVQRFKDPVTLAAANELENLSTAMARKIWQKIMIIRLTENNTSQPPPLSDVVSSQIVSANEATTHENAL